MTSPNTTQAGGKRPARRPLDGFTIDGILAAAPAPQRSTIEVADEADLPDASRPETSAEHALCEAWAGWSRSRRLYGPPPLAAGVLGKLTAKARKLGTGPDAYCSAELMALHLAITAQPMDVDRVVFELHYRWRVKGIKLAAAELGISASTWHRKLGAFRSRIYAARQAILAENLQQAEALPHRLTALEVRVS
ncbi:MAG: hypothetical protein RL375_3351 [Pseudomonadota bacterium]|jgi:hypothetical protein